ncbi:MAG: phage protease, partial [Syntrophobacteraceae bacterium]
EWTTKAREYLANKEYRYFSPVFYTSKATKRLVALVRVALTNAPRLRGIEPIVSKQTDPGGTDMEFLKRIAKLLGLPETANEEQVSAALTSLQGIADYFKSVASSVGLAETASKDDVTRAISGLRQKTQVVACKDVLDALGLQADSKTNEVVATIHALRQRPDATLAQEFASLKTKLAERDRDDLVTAALKEGKITPAQKEWADAYALRDAEGFRLFVAKAPQVVPTTPVVPKKDDKAGSALDETQLNINKMLGISDETWKKYNPAPAA